MKIKLNLLILLAATIILSVSCQPKNKTKENLAPNVHKVTAEEVIQASGYTYLRVSEDGKENWIAISRQEVEKGKSYYYEPNIEMTNFVSKELKRTFPSIIFVVKFSDQPITTVKTSTENIPKGNQPAIAKDGLKVEQAEGGITIAELFAGKDSYAGKTVKIKGEVVKFNPEIMGKNWVHIQDGTNNNGSFDITITTNDSTKVGNVVTFEGTVTLKKDFGYGYFYEVLVENGKLLPAK
ncbi:MAG: GW dipeptide domain-containing protein [Bacteroidia bacterium]|nr:GW dipeptide domain-containing protein [Bacteroidia bacterium]